MPSQPPDITELLDHISSGDRNAWNLLLAQVYRELHSLAHGAMRKQQAGRTLQTTALVHEAYIRLVKDKGGNWKNRGHFFSVAATAMRQILVDQYRKRRAAKRGKDHRPMSLDPALAVQPEASGQEYLFENMDALDRALIRMNEQGGNERKCKIVELHFFVGLTLDEVAEVLGVSRATVMRDWKVTKAWLYQEMKG